MPREFSPEISTTENRKFKLAYLREFRQILREHPGVIRTAIELVDRAVVEYDPVNFTLAKGEGITMRYDKKRNLWLEQWPEIKHDWKSGEWIETGHTKERKMKFNRGTILIPGHPVKDRKSDLSVTILGRSNREGMGEVERKDLCDYFKITLAGHSYFVKRSFVTNNPGFVEFHNTRLAEYLISHSDTMKVVRAELGYQDKKESWFISDWEDLENSGFRPTDYALSANDYGEILEMDEEGSRYAEKIITELREILYEKGLGTDLRTNLFYNPRTKKFLLLDVSSHDLLTEGKTLGDPIKNKRKL